MRILVIEDDPRISEALRSGLSEEMFIVDVCADGADGEFLAATNPYSAIILDVLLPGMNGIEVCRALRAANVHTPILMLTARDETADKISGLNSGADDYLTKPFVFAELLARLRALLRRGPMLPDGQLDYEHVSLDTIGHVVTVDGQVVEVTAKEYIMLEFFLRNVGKVLSRQQLAEQAWGAAYDPISNVVDVYISYLRKKVDMHADYQLIHTVRGLGYMLKRKPRRAGSPTP